MHKNANGFSANRRTLTKATLVSLAAMKVGGSTLAQDATPDASPVSGVVGVEVLLEGLADPRFVAIDGDDVLFTESGTGGDEPVFTIPGEGTPEPEAPISGTGHTGKLSRLSSDGSVTEIVSDFRSYTFGDHGEIVGAAGVVLDGEGSAYVTVGAPGPFVGEMPLTGEEGVVYKVDLASGEKEVIADLLTWELEENPDPWFIDSNIYGLDLLDDVLYVADAGGNTIISVDVESGEVATFAVTGGLDAPFLPDSGNPARGGELEIDSVPSTVVVGPDDRLYVSYVTGGPFPAGLAPVDAFSADGSVETVAQGLTMVADIAFDSAGRLYASMISTDFLTQAPGQIVRVEEDGSLTVIADGLVMPAGIAFDAEDNLYALTFSSVVPGGGQLVRITGAADVPASGGDDGTAEPEASPVESGDTVNVTLNNGEIQPAELTIVSNTDVTITVTNDGSLGHDFTIEDTDLTTSLVDVGGSADLVVNLQPGSYTYYCSVPGHREAGMQGTLTVE